MQSLPSTALHRPKQPKNPRHLNESNPTQVPVTEAFIYLLRLILSRANSLVFTCPLKFTTCYINYVSVFYHLFTSLIQFLSQNTFQGKSEHRQSIHLKVWVFWHAFMCISVRPKLFRINVWIIFLNRWSPLNYGVDMSCLRAENG